MSSLCSTAVGAINYIAFAMMAVQQQGISMSPRLLTRLCLPRTSLVVLAFLLLPGMVVAQEAISVRLDPVGESEVNGTATLIAAGDGTNVTLDITGLAPEGGARATMHANTCAMPSASFAALPDLKADSTGRATATGSVLFHSTENVALATMADGEHIIKIHTDGQVVACGVIPTLTSASAPTSLPVTGDAAFWPMAATASVLGLCALSAGLFLRQRSRPRHRLHKQLDSPFSPAVHSASYATLGTGSRAQAAVAADPLTEDFAVVGFRLEPFQSRS